LSQWKNQLLEVATDVFNHGNKSKDKEKHQAMEADLLQQYWLPEVLRLTQAEDEAGVAGKI